MLGFLPGIHRPAHDPELVVALQGGDRLPGIELDGIPGDPVLGQEIAEDRGVLHIGMLEDENAHLLTLLFVDLDEIAVPNDTLDQDRGIDPGLSLMCDGDLAEDLRDLLRPYRDRG